jgi:AcrR family transcriptional regulator
MPPHDRGKNEAMVSSLRERRKQMLREEILEAARVLLSEKGYVAMSMDDLAAQVGISKPTLYSHFPTKDFLVVKTAIREMERFIALIETDIDGQTPLRRLITVMRKFIKFHDQKESMEPRSWTPELFQLLCADEQALGCMRRIDAAIVALIQASIAAGEIDRWLDPATVASAFFGLASSLRHARFTRAEPTHPSASEMLLTIFERGIRAPET